ncbi:GTPase Era, mitochondrial [Diorhabda sublineata]|uniref:GTPase Era, mitochondrial n=1 Tax=Diorhabda sublineata TaxID=1163346 RepID=UPI0024E07F4C|nr:GTPase Era, mitochondrial [Diorhabda sublineata]
MLCPCMGRFIFKTNSSLWSSKVFFSTIKQNVLDSSTRLMPEASNCDTRLLKVAIIGMPNAGKSTFINGLMDRKVCATSLKVHTTRSKAKAIFTRDDTQIVFFDSPGLVNDREMKKFNLQNTFSRDCRSISKEADIIGVIHDASNIWTREKLDIKIIKILEKHKEKSSFLILNKVDKLNSKRKLLDITKILTENSISGKPIGMRKIFEKECIENKGWPYFSNIFMVSALTGDGLTEIQDYLITNAKPGEWMFPEEVWTDQNPESIILNTVRGVLLDYLPQEIPYKLKPIMEYFHVDELTGKINTVVLIDCPTSRIARLLSGTSDGRLRLLTEQIQGDLQNAFKNFVKIQIIPKYTGSSK